LPTAAFFLATIIVFALPHLYTRIVGAHRRRSALATRSVALYRHLAYKSFRIAKLDWNSAPIGALLLAVVGILFFASMILGPKPYYWPNTRSRSFGNSPPIATRAGWMSIACMPFIFATPSRSNFISVLTGVSHAKLQVFHRWISYVFFVLALVHTFPFVSDGTVLPPGQARLLMIHADCLPRLER